MKLKTNYSDLGVRVVPHAVARYGSYISSGVIMMPSYVNVGPYLMWHHGGYLGHSWFMCTNWKKCTFKDGGVGIGGVLEPLQASPVIVEDGSFIGSRCILVEGARVGKEAVLGANVVITKSTKIIDITGPKASL